MVHLPNGWSEQKTTAVAEKILGLGIILFGRQMEVTPGSGTCNHGRSTYIQLKLVDIERLPGGR
ncbi:hypothetical protein MES5069_180086 [Mesorhizobium escarrei]|uniref:Uncharacterized protein n=1 Tax=Mesorhizobium escarrei TaxID=666018 RepID=A0ABN8JKR6_9HYPH|nr:hypothetical protein MES5069_180086 [Mesorhizobium escarrei]